MADEPQLNLYKVIYQRTELRITAAAADKLPQGSMAIVNVVAGGFLAACERAAQMQQEEYPQMRIVAVKETVTDVRQ